jgi:hypothetical protein
MTPFSEVFKRHKQKFVQKFKNFKNHCENYPRKQNLLEAIVLYLLFVFFFLFQNIRIKKLRNDTGWVSQTQMPSRPKTAQELLIN